MCEAVGFLRRMSPILGYPPYQRYALVTVMTAYIVCPSTRNLAILTKGSDGEITSNVFSVRPVILYTRVLEI